MMKIDLKDLHFRGRHGLYAEEQVLGNEFVVNATILYRPSSIPVTQISETIDYSEVFHLIRERMKDPTPLLETLATEICQAIGDRFEKAEEVTVSITKVHPPVEGWDGSVAVGYTWKRRQQFLL